MRIKKMYQGTVPENKILDTYSTSATDTYSCNYVNQIDNYSETETKTGGKWIDGYPIYRKVVTKTLNGNADQTVDLGIATVLRNLVKFEGYIYKSGQGYRPLNSTYFSSLNYAVQTFINDNKILQIQAGSSARDILNGATLYLIVEYTKTTD